MKTSLRHIIVVGWPTRDRSGFLPSVRLGAFGTIEGRGTGLGHDRFHLGFQYVTEALFHFIFKYPKSRKLLKLKI